MCQPVVGIESDRLPVCPLGGGIIALILKRVAQPLIGEEIGVTTIQIRRAKRRDLSVLGQGFRLLTFLHEGPRQLQMSLDIIRLAFDGQAELINCTSIVALLLQQHAELQERKWNRVSTLVLVYYA